FVLLAFLALKEKKAVEFLQKQMGIVGLESVLFVLHQPPWKGQPGGDPRFWKAIGVVQEFLSTCFQYALAPIRTKAPVDGGQPKDHLFLFIKDVERLQELAAVYSTQQQFFKQLESTHISKLLAEVRIKVRVKGSHHPITFRELA